MSTDLSWPQAPPPITIPPVTPSGDVPPPAPSVDVPPATASAQLPAAPPVSEEAALVPPPDPVPSYAVFARLSTGDRIEVAAHDDEATARAEATALMRYLRDGRGDWPYLDGRFVRPEAIVSVDIDGA